MRFTLSASILLSMMAVVAATPAKRSYNCPVASAKLSLPQNDMVKVPSGATPKYIALGNYTCSSTGTYASAGAVAVLIDLGCVYWEDSALYGNIQNKAYDIIQKSGIPSLKQIGGLLGYEPFVLGDHYFTTQNGAIAPEFDFRARSKKGDPNAYSITKKTGGIPSPSGSGNVDWLQLQSTSGALTNYVFRVDTKAGVAPQTCNKPGQTITVQYTAKYWFFK